MTWPEFLVAAAMVALLGGSLLVQFLPFGRLTWPVAASASGIASFIVRIVPPR